MTKQITDSERLLLQNKAWAQLRRLQDPELFDKLSISQAPRFLWIGCSDSRVPAETITGAQPGEIFVHRNIANVVVHTDLNLFSVLAYAVDVLKVEHVIVCGHHGCGGVRAAMTDNDFGLLNMWLRNIKDVYFDNMSEVDAVVEKSSREDLLVELNARAQLHNLAKTAVIQRAWKERNGPSLHAWVYNLTDGVLHELETIKPGTNLNAPYQLQFDDNK
jgi:carbonic anhydrase